MHAQRKSRLWWCAVIAACLTACQAFSPRSTPPTPPRVTDCLSVPEGVYPNEPARPAALTDAYVRALHAWANTILGIATTDRVRWAGERDCVRRLRDAGQVR